MVPDASCQWELVVVLVTEVSTMRVWTKAKSSCCSDPQSSPQMPGASYQWEPVPAVILGGMGLC